MEGDHPPHSMGQKISVKRKKILEMAFAQLRKSRAAMDPKVLSKIRRLVASSPDIMKKLGVTEALKPDDSMPLSGKGTVKEAKAPTKPMKAVKSTKAPREGYESVDQEKNMEVMAKLMALNPKRRDKIKSAIKKAVD